MHDAIRVDKRSSTRMIKPATAVTVTITVTAVPPFNFSGEERGPAQGRSADGVQRHDQPAAAEGCRGTRPKAEADDLCGDLPERGVRRVGVGPGARWFHQDSTDMAMFYAYFYVVHCSTINSVVHLCSCTVLFLVHKKYYSRAVVHLMVLVFRRQHTMLGALYLAYASKRIARWLFF